MRIPIASIRLDGGTQTRAGGIDPATVEDYAEKMKDGAVFPAVVVFEDAAGVRWLADGFHRIEAALLAGLVEIEADIRVGSVRDALLFAAGANASHGLRRKPADIRRAIAMLLDDPGCEGWSNRDVAKAVQCAHSTVNTVMKERAGEPGRPAYQTRNGKAVVMDLDAIGERQERRAIAHTDQPAVVTEAPAGPSLEIPAEAFRVGVVAGKTGRYATGCVAVERSDGVGRAVATDGKRILVASWQSAGEPIPETLVPLEAWQRAGQLSRDGQVTLTADSEKVGFTVAGDGATSALSTLAGPGRFPDWRRFVQAAGGASCTEGQVARLALPVNAHLLSELLAAVGSMMPGSDHTEATLYLPSGPGSPLLIRAKGRTVEVLAVVAPLDDDAVATVRVEARPPSTRKPDPVPTPKPPVQAKAARCPCNRSKACRPGGLCNRCFYNLHQFGIQPGPTKTKSEGADAA